MTLKNTLKHDTVIYKVIKDSNILVKWNSYYSFPLVIVYVCACVYSHQISDKYEKIPFVVLFCILTQVYALDTAVAHLFAANTLSPSVSGFPSPPLQALGTYLLPYSHPPHLGSRSEQRSPSLLPADTQNLSGAIVLLFGHSVMSDSATPWTAALQASLSFTISQSLLTSCPLKLGCHPTISSVLSPSPPALNFSQHQVLFQ